MSIFKKIKCLFNILVVMLNYDLFLFLLCVVIFLFHFFSLHLSKVFTHQMKNMRDCKEVGVYHTHKVAMTYPFQIKYDGDKFPNITFKYMIPESEKKVLYYYTESGTYAGRKDLQSLPMNGANVPIRRLPAPFKV